MKFVERRPFADPDAGAPADRLANGLYYEKSCIHQRRDQSRDGKRDEGKIKLGHW
jgi:hypothetical protein